MSSLPTGTITFLFTDIEGSTKRWEANPSAMQAAFACQEAILRHVIAANSGYAYKMIGDAFQAAFPTAPQALQAAIDAQRSLHSQTWPAETGEVRVRMALHTGSTTERGDDYVGPTLNLVARLLSAGHGGQILLSEVTYGLVRDALPDGVRLQDMGEHRLKDLVRPEHIFQLVVSSLPSEFPPLNTLDNRPNNLPLQPTPLIGREKELAEVQEMLGREEVRLLTLTAAGGTGKTRLGLQSASEVLDDYQDGVWFVDLSPLIDSGLVVPTIASVLGVKEAGGGIPIIDTLKEYLKGKSMLLMLDNFEQVADAAPHVSQLLASSPHLKVLATSRVPLSIRGEKEYPVPPLSVPDIRDFRDVRHLPPLERLTQYEAVRLFIERATDVKPDFQVTNENAPAIAQICVQMDGLPLAIELAAARIRMLSPDALLLRLSQRLKVLIGGAKDLPERQQTLRNTIGWSYELLDEGEKQLFRRMAPFSGGRNLEALEAVCNYDGRLGIDVFEGTASLLSKNLLKEVEGRGGKSRFWMLETIHEYATEKLEESGETDALQKEHALYFMALVEEAEPELIGKKQAEWYDRLEEAHDNIRAALRWARDAGEIGTEGEAASGAFDAGDVGLRIAGAMGLFWRTRGDSSEGREQLEIFLSTPPAVPANGESVDNIDLAPHKRARARALIAVGMLAYRQGYYETARTGSEEALAIGTELGDRHIMALALGIAGDLALDKGDYPRARSLYEQSLAQSEKLGDKWGIATSLDALGLVAMDLKDYPTARSRYEESLALFREVRDKRSIAFSLLHLGTVAYLEGDYHTARSVYEEGLSQFRELGDKSGVAWTLGGLGNVAYSEGDYPAARSLDEESLALFREVGYKFGIAGRLAGLGAAAIGTGASLADDIQKGREAERIRQAEWGAKLLGAAEGLRAAIGAVLDPQSSIPYQQGVESARSLLGEEEFNRATQEGRGMSLEQAIEYALEKGVGSQP